MAKRKVAKKRASSVSATKLSAAVERAVKVASARSKDVRLEASSRVQPGHIVGRIVRGNITLQAAQSLAADITTQVAKSGATTAALQPAVLALDKRILLGYIDPTFSLELR